MCQCRARVVSKEVKQVPVLGMMFSIVRVIVEITVAEKVTTKRASIFLLPSYMAYMRICKMTMWSIFPVG